MKIEVQIGTIEERRFRRKEIVYFLTLIGLKIIKQLNIKKIIVSSDLGKTVNVLQNNNNYQSKRHMVECHGIIISDENGDTCVVFSDFWNNCLDQKFRLMFFSHEIYHVINSITLPKITKNSISELHYLNILYQIYNEYSAIRFSLKLFKKPFDENFKKCIEILYDGYFNPLQDPKNFYKPLKLEILKFRIGMLSIDEFFKSSYLYIEPIYIYLCYIFAFKDSLDFIEEKFNNSVKDLFINENTYNLFTKIRYWYESDENINFDDGLDEVKNFLQTLCLSFSDNPNGLYIEVLNI